jgi:hypothetical protein
VRVEIEHEAAVGPGLNLVAVGRLGPIPHQDGRNNGAWNRITRFGEHLARDAAIRAGGDAL